MKKGISDQRWLEIKLILTFHADADTRKALADLVGEVDRLRAELDRLDASIIQRDREEVKW